LKLLLKPAAKSVTKNAYTKRKYVNECYQVLKCANE